MFFSQFNSHEEFTGYETWMASIHPEEGAWSLVDIVVFG